MMIDMSELIKEKQDSNAEAFVFQRRLIRHLLLFAILTTILSLGTAWYEIGSFQKHDSPAEKSAQTKGAMVAIEPPTPVIDMLPESIIQYETRAKQNIPGSSYPSAEAIYELLDPNIMLQNPINTYVRVTYYPTAKDAKVEIIDLIESRFPNNSKDELIGSTIVKTGYDSQADSYLVGWTNQNFSVVLITSFLNKAPVNKKTMLSDHATPIAQSMISGAKISGPPNKPKEIKEGT